MRLRNRLFLIGAVLVCASPVSLLEAQIFGVGGATEWTQLLNYAQLVAMLAKEVDQIVQMQQIVMLMIKEGKQLALHPSTDILSDLTQLSTIMRQSQTLAADMATLDGRFRQQYGIQSGQDPLPGYAIRYNDWANTSLNNIHGMLASAGVQANLLQNEQAWTQKMQFMNNSEQGRNESLQLGNTIALEMVAQIQKLRQLMIADMEAKAAYTAQRVSAAAARQNANQNSLSHIPFTSDTKAYE